MKEKLVQGLFFERRSIFVVNSEISFHIFLSLQRMNLTFKTLVCPAFRINSTGSLPCIMEQYRLYLIQNIFIPHNHSHFHTTPYYTIVYHTFSHGFNTTNTNKEVYIITIYHTLPYYPHHPINIILI